MIEEAPEVNISRGDSVGPSAPSNESMPVPPIVPPMTAGWKSFNSISFGGIDHDLMLEIATSDIKLAGIVVTSEKGKSVSVSSSSFSALEVAEEVLPGLRQRQARSFLHIVGMGMGPPPLISEARLPQNINKKLRDFLKEAKPNGPVRVLDLTCG